jgi:hypothetical protein
MAELKLDIVDGICRVRIVRGFLALAVLLGALGIGCGPSAARPSASPGVQTPEVLGQPPAIAFFSHPKRSDRPWR